MLTSVETTKQEKSTQILTIQTRNSFHALDCTGTRCKKVYDKTANILLIKHTDLGPDNEALQIPPRYFRLSHHERKQSNTHAEERQIRKKNNSKTPLAQKKT